ncbi:MAG: divergent polysaccharide deacetylase superfamily protein [Gammaproteobacteria bacterium]|jgi:polysaccharide deacetylase 2 family uncharacterized protein YibQ|nr:divergent polysaccharide deacetylase superfamily protein [Gammaproteobacteria bacterium]
MRNNNKILCFLKNRFRPLLYSLLLLLSSINCLAEQPISHPKISIIIDDLGNHPHLDSEIASLPGPIVCSVLPYRPFTKAVIKQAKQRQKPIILHIPMQAQSEVALGAGGLTTQLNKNHFTRILQRQLAAYPDIQGVSNHMGSKLTQNQEHMEWLMEELSKHDLFFVDSRTAINSLAEKTAKQYNIPSLHRDVFLDNIKNYQAVDKQFQALLNLAKKYGQAVAIGHPYPITVKYLQQAIPKLAEQGIELVPISELLSPIHNADLN